MSQSQGDVDEHGGVADQYGGDVTVALPVDLILNAALRVEGDGEVRVAVVFQKADEPEKEKRNMQVKVGTVVTPCVLWGCMCMH